MLRELVADADVVIENFRPGVLEKWGLGPDTLLRGQPGLVVLRVTGFGQDRAVREAARVRHPGRGDERASPTRPGRRTDRRRCRRSGSPTGSPASTGAYAVMTRALPPGRRRRRRAGPGHRPVAAGTAGRHPRPGPERLRPARDHRRPARQPVAQQRPAQRLPHQRRPLGRDLGQRHLGRRAGHAPGRPRRPRRASRGSPRPASAPRTPTCSTAPWRSGSRARRLDEVSAAFEDAGAALRADLRRRAADERPARAGARR